MSVSENALVTALAAGLFRVYAERGGKAEVLTGQALTWGKPVLTLDCAANRLLLDLGVCPAAADTMADAWKSSLVAGSL